VFVVPLLPLSQQQKNIKFGLYPNAT
jgi:hypothetical protein